MMPSQLTGGQNRDMYTIDFNPTPWHRAVWSNREKGGRHETFKETRESMTRRNDRLQRITLKLGGSL